MRSTLVLSVRGSLPPGAPGDPPPEPPTTADADAGPLAASHIPDTEAEALMPSAPNLKMVPPAFEDPRRLGPSADAGGDDIVGDSMAVAEAVAAAAAAAAAPTVNDLRRRVIPAAAAVATSLQVGDDDDDDDIGRPRLCGHNTLYTLAATTRGSLVSLVSHYSRGTGSARIRAAAANYARTDADGRAHYDERDGRPIVGVHLAVPPAWRGDPQTSARCRRGRTDKYRARHERTVFMRHER